MRLRSSLSCSKRSTRTRHQKQAGLKGPTSLSCGRGCNWPDRPVKKASSCTGCTQHPTDRDGNSNRSIATGTEHISVDSPRQDNNTLTAALNSNIDTLKDSNTANSSESAQQCPTLILEAVPGRIQYQCWMARATLAHVLGRLFKALLLAVSSRCWRGATPVSMLSILPDSHTTQFLCTIRLVWMCCFQLLSFSWFFMQYVSHCCLWRECTAHLGCLSSLF